MSGELATPNVSAQELALFTGDLGKLSAEERQSYMVAVCKSTGLNPLTQPFQYITLNGRLTLYATRGATDQLRELRGVSITGLTEELWDGVYIVTASAQDKVGRTDSAKGAVCIAALKGDALANAIMKAETKAKRRVTLSICGLGYLDESELETVADVRPAPPVKPAERKALPAPDPAVAPRPVKQGLPKTGAELIDRARAQQTSANGFPPGNNDLVNELTTYAEEQGYGTDIDLWTEGQLQSLYQFAKDFVRERKAALKGG